MSDRRMDHLYSAETEQKRPMVIQHTPRNRPTPPPPRGPSPHMLSVQTEQGLGMLPMQGSPLMQWPGFGMTGPSISPVPEQGGVPLIPMHGSPLAQWQLEMIEATFKQGSGQRASPFRGQETVHRASPFRGVDPVQRVSPFHNQESSRPRSREQPKSQGHTPPRGQSRGTPPSSRGTPPSASRSTPPSSSHMKTSPQSIPASTNAGSLPLRGQVSTSMLDQYLGVPAPGQAPMRHPDLMRVQGYPSAVSLQVPNTVPVYRPPPPLHMAPGLASRLPGGLPQGSRLPDMALLTQQGLLPEGYPHMLPTGLISSEQQVPIIKEEKYEEEDENEMVEIPNPFNMRVVNLNNFPVKENTYRSAYRSQAVAMHRAKAGSITSAAKSLDILRQTLQKSINKDIDEIIQKYIDIYFKVAIENIRLNNGDNTMTDEHIQGVCRQMLEEAKKMYISDARSSTPAGDLSDNVSESGSVTRELIFGRRIPKKKRHASESDSEASQPVKKKKRGRHTGSSTPQRISKELRKEGEKWDPERLTSETKFIMGSKANKALGLGATRGRLYIKHPDVFKYSGDQDDKVWLYENRRMPATGGKAYMLIVEDIQDLIDSDEYKGNPGLMPELIKGFQVPEWMLAKMKIQMNAMRSDGPKIKTESSPSPTPLSEPNVHNNRALEDNAVDADVESDKNVPFTTANSSLKSLADCKRELQPSPTNTEEMDLLSTDGGDEREVSPFGMTGGFGDGHGVSSDIDGLDDEPPLSAPFDIS